MNFDTHRRLGDLAEATGQEYGKLVQKFLAIAFCESGAHRVTERSTQGIDIEVVLADGRPLAVEVKTTLTGVVTFASGNINGLENSLARGYEPYLAVLGSRLVDDWLLARFWTGEIQANRTYSPNRLRPYRDAALEALLSPLFEQAVVKHGDTAMRDRQGGLDAVMRAYRCYAAA